jgi:hypothetical protein
MQIQLGIKFYAHVQNCGLARSGQGSVKYDRKFIYVYFRFVMDACVKTVAYAMIPQTPVWSSRRTTIHHTFSLNRLDSIVHTDATYVHKKGHADGGGSGEN